MENIHPENLIVGFIQTDLHWKSAEANCAHFEELISNFPKQVDLWVLPEMFTTGFTMDAKEMAEPMNFYTCRWMKLMAQQTQSILTGSVIIKENGSFYNRLLWVTPNGDILQYDKRHLFRMAGEDEHFSMGSSLPVFECKGWRILPQICYDLRFPVWSRNQSSQGVLKYDLAIYVANWPAPRTLAWDILLKARAVENLCYVLGVNRIGIDGNEIEYAGHSAAYNYKGETLKEAKGENGCFIVELNKKELDIYRNKFPAWMDADQFEIKANTKR
jgi:omega-amidase